MQQKAGITIYYSSFHHGGIEAIQSRRLLFLMSALPAKYTAHDLNKDSNPEIEKSRVELWQCGILMKIDGEISLPQLFINNEYLGNYNDVQYLHDSDLLLKIFSGILCPHFYKFGRSDFLKPPITVFINGIRQCLSCYVKKWEYKEFVIYCYPRDWEHKESVEVVKLLAESKQGLIYKLVDYDNTGNTEKEKLPVTASIRGKKLAYTKLIKIIKSGIVQDLIKGIRCIGCGRTDCKEIKEHSTVSACLEKADCEPLFHDTIKTSNYRMTMSGNIQITKLKFKF